jgi:hypothetical protein
MQLNRLRVGEVLTAVGSLGLFATLFFDWFEPEGRLPVPIAPEDGWSGLGWVLVVLLLVAIAASLTLVVLTVAVEPVGLTVSVAAVTTAIGIIATLALLIRLALAQPDLGYGLGDSQVHLMPAAYVGLLACALLAVGAWVAFADERTEAPYSAPPELTPRPIPPTV